MINAPQNCKNHKCRQEIKPPVFRFFWLTNLSKLFKEEMSGIFENNWRTHTTAIIQAHKYTLASTHSRAHIHTYTSRF